MNWTDTIPFLGTYPLWARILVVVCVVLIICVLAFTPRQLAKGDRSGESPTSSELTLSPPQERILVLIANYQRQYATNKLIISRADGRLFFDGNPEKGKEVSLVRDLYGAINDSTKKEFIDLIESLPPDYLRVFPEMRWDSPFVVGITEAGSVYIRRHQ